MPTRALLSRRELLAAAAAVAAGAACGSGGVFSNARSARLFASRPHPEDYTPVLRALARTLLPLEHPAFGPQLEHVEARLFSYFPLGDAEYANVRQALMYFDDVTLAPHVAAPIGAAERAAMGNAATAEAAAEVDARVELEARGWAARRFAATRFAELAADERSAYLRGWAHSQLMTKRRFYRSTKSMIMVAAFSLPATWPAIGYDGPLRERA